MWSIVQEQYAGLDCVNIINVRCIIWVGFSYFSPTIDHLYRLCQGLHVVLRRIAECIMYTNTQECYLSICAKLVDKSRWNSTDHYCITLEFLKNRTDFLHSTYNVCDFYSTINDPLSDIAWKLGVSNTGKKMGWSLIYHKCQPVGWYKSSKHTLSLGPTYVITPIQIWNRSTRPCYNTNGALAKVLFYMIMSWWH